MASEGVQLIRNLLIIWSILYVLKYIFKTSSFRKLKNKINKIAYFQLNNLSLTVSTNKFNFIFQIGTRFSNFFKRFYKLGILYAYIASVFGIGILFYSSFQIVVYLLEHKTNSLQKRSFQQEQIIKPMIPGLTIPLENIPIYIFSFLLAAIVHELGHALASQSHRVEVKNFALFFKIIYCGAYVEIDTQTYELLDIVEKLCVISGGIWNNFVTFIVCYLVHYFKLISIILVMLGLFSNNNYLFITNIHSQSPLNNHIQKGDILVGVNDQNVVDFKQWEKAVSKQPIDSMGFCVRKQVIKDQDASCCNIEQQNESACFKDIKIGNLACLPPLKVFQQIKRCDDTQICNTDELCLIPNRIEDKMDWNRIYIKKSKNDMLNLDTKMVLYYGDIKKLKYYVSVNNVIPNVTFLPFDLINTLSDYLLYCLSFNIALSIFNILPIYHSDGDAFLFQSLLLTYNYYFPRYNSLESSTLDSKWMTCYKFILFFFSSLTAGLFLTSIIVLFI